jgi:dTDP-glucose pyrophosphorylase
MSLPITAIVLAAGGLPESLRALYGNGTAAMVPLNGRPVIHRQMAYLLSCGVQRVVIGVQAGEARLPDFVQRSFGSQLAIEIVDAPTHPQAGPGDTLLACLQQIDAHSPVLVVLGDTLFELPAGADGDFILLQADPGGSRRWCYAAVDGQQQVTALIDKPANPPIGHDVLIGTYVVQDVALGRASLEAVQDGTRREMRHFLEPYVSAGSMRGLRAAAWFDCGNPDLLLDSRRRLIAAREFNEIEIDARRGTITKRSRDTGKFLNEINYYRLLPADLQPFFPRVFDSCVRPGQLSITCEFYGYPTLSDLWVFGDLHVDVWQRIFRRLRDILECFAEYALPIQASGVEKFYLSKTTQRVANLAGQDARFAELVAAERITLNGKRLLGWSALTTYVQARMPQLAKDAMGHVIHGDLCFPNILHDPVSDVVKLIDVRGSFVDVGTYGDARYDVAKLLHSIHGGYDCLIREMFRLVGEGTEWTLEVFHPRQRASVMQAFDEAFGSRFAMADIRLIESLLFISMAALHREDPTRQLAMFLTGIQLLNDHHQTENP